MVDQDHSPGCRDTGQGGHEVRQTVLLLQLVETDMGEGGLGGGEGYPVQVRRCLVELPQAELEGVALRLWL